MSQTGDYDIANASGSTVREDINNTLINVLTANSGGSAPSYKETGTLWLNTSANRFEYYTGSAWHPFLETNGNGIFQTGSSYVGITASGSIEIQSDNGPVHIDFKRSGVDYDCRISQTNDTNYDFVIETGGDGNITNAVKCLSTGSIEVGDAGIGGTRGLSSGGYSKGAVNAKGYATRNGTGGSNSANLFNFSWASPNVTAWIDNVVIGTAATASDYRVKQNIALQTEAGIDKVKLLKPSTFQYKDYEGVFKADGITREGFIAHEIQEVIPSGATGSKDGTEIQSLKLDAIVSVLTKALQEAVAKIETLETKVAALEAK